MQPMGGAERQGKKRSQVGIVADWCLSPGRLHDASSRVRYMQYIHT